MVVVVALLLLVACFAFGCSEVEAVGGEVAAGTDSAEPVAGFLVLLRPLRLPRANALGSELLVFPFSAL